MKLYGIKTDLDVNFQTGSLEKQLAKPYVFDNDDEKLQIELFTQHVNIPPSVGQDKLPVRASVSIIHTDQFTWNWMRPRCVCIPVRLEYITSDAHLILNFRGIYDKVVVCFASCVIRQFPDKVTVLGSYPKIGDEYYLLIDFDPDKR